MTSNKAMHLIASKLGLEDEERVICKAEEFLRLLQTKSMAGSNMTDTSKIVICLNLAANLLNVDVDVKLAFKYSGLKPLFYNNSRKVVENLLEINSEKLTIPILCASLQCSGVQDLADRILEEYRKQAVVEIDLNLPQYVCMAVYQACRVNKVKTSKSKLIEKSRLKAMQWSKLEAEWSKFADQHFAVAKKKRGRPAKKAGEDEKLDKMDIDIAHKTDPEPEQPIESYDDWKRRMLETAYKELAEMEKQRANEKENMQDRVKAVTPRRSPRKTPQKFSPYKSPSKSIKGVRLLFPLDF